MKVNGIYAGELGSVKRFLPRNPSKTRVLSFLGGDSMRRSLPRLPHQARGAICIVSKLVFLAPKLPQPHIFNKQEGNT